MNQHHHPRPLSQTGRSVLFKAAIAGIAVTAVVALWLLAPRIPTSLPGIRAAVAALGPFGPFGLIALQIAQILIAPVPGYPVAVAAGLLFDGFFGGLYSTIGMLVGAWLAATLARRFGRPLVERLVARHDLHRWMRLALNDSPWFWFLVVLLPTGEAPYFLAGLSRVPIGAFLLAVLITRAPGNFVIAALASRALEVSPRMAAAAALPLVVLAGIAFWQRRRLANWIEARLAQRLPLTPSHRDDSTGMVG